MSTLLGESTFLFETLFEKTFKKFVGKKNPTLLGKSVCYYLKHCWKCNFEEKNRIKTLMGSLLHYFKFAISI
jgi:hypothetical protein